MNMEKEKESQLESVAWDRKMKTTLSESQVKKR